MKEHTFTKNTGNFSYAVTIEVGDSDTKRDIYFKENGTVREIQGAVLAGWEKAIAYPGDAKRKDVPQVIGDDGALRDWTRSDIPFTEENARALEKAIGSFQVDIGGDVDGKHVKELVDSGILDVVASKYERNAAYVPKYSEEKSAVKLYLTSNGGLLKDGSARTIASYIASPSHGRGELPMPTEPWEEDTGFLQALKELRAKKAAEAAAGE